MGIADEVRARRRGVRLSAQRLFTNREREKKRFAAKVHESRSVCRGEWALDLRSPRRNVIAFHGYGGIGKTRLSNELERAFLYDSSGASKRAAVRVDFSEPSARDAELYLLALRAGLAPLADAFPAFDTALVVYWSRQHPGASMSEFVRHQSVLGGLADRETLAANLRGFVEGLVDSAGPLVSGARRLVGLTWEKVREARTVRHLEQECPFFASCMAEESIDDMRLHLPLLLAWDLMRLQRREVVDVVVFLDTFEHVAHGRRTARNGDLEDAIVRSVFFLQGVTFVVTSRNRLDWGEPRRASSLEYSGPQDWPGLTQSDGSDQHEVGVFSPEDSESYLARCLLDEHGQPAVSEELRVGIAGLSGGVPLYLDVAVNHYLSLVANQQTPTMEDFAAGIPEIVMRLMEDLDEKETDLLRVAALLRVFDRATLLAALPDVRSSTADRFLARTFVVARDDGTFAVHELLQVSVRSQDAATSNPWSEPEWQRVEERLVAHWSSQFRDRGAELWRDRAALALAFWQLAGLYATTDVDAEVLAEVVMLVQLQGAWATLDAGRDQPSELVNERGSALILVLDGVLARQFGNLEDADAFLSEALEMPALTGNVARLARYYLGETRDIHEGEATSLFHELATIDDRIGAEARLAHAHSLTRQGDLSGALQIAEQFSGDLRDPEFRYRHEELMGVIWLFAGRFRQAARHFEDSRQVGEDESSALLLALGLRHLALALCWVDPIAAMAVVDEAEPLNRDLNLPPGVGQCLMARAVSSVGSVPLDETDELLADADATFRRAGYLDDALGPLALGVFAAAVDGDRSLALRRRQTLIDRGIGRRARTWLAAADAWTGSRDHFDRISWPQGRDAAYDEWAGLVGRRADRG